MNIGDINVATCETTMVGIKRQGNNYYYFVFSCIKVVLFKHNNIYKCAVHNKNEVQACIHGKMSSDIKSWIFFRKVSKF